LREAKILEFLSHPNIVKFREVYKTKKGRLCIVMEYADGNFIINSKVVIYLKKSRKLKVNIFLKLKF